MRKCTFVSERIVNISVLEKILEHERLTLEALRKELDKNQPDLKYVKKILEKVLSIHNQAVSFEFCLEQRKVKKSTHTF